VFTPFDITLLRVSDTLETIETEKTWRITASSNLTITSQWAGEISKILYKEWQKVKAGTSIAVLKDTINNFDLRLAQAENAITTQDATIETTKINLDQSVENARIGLERARQSYESLKDKNSIQYDSVVNANGKTLDAYNQNYKSYLSDIDRLMTQTLHDADKLLGMTDAYDDIADDLEWYLGARNGWSYYDAEKAWNSMYALRGIIREKKNKANYLSRDTLDADIALVWSGYAELQKFSDAMILMIQNNVVWAGLSQIAQDGYTAAWNGYKASIQWAETVFNAWKAQTISFFNTYKNTELANKLALASLTRKLTRDELSIIEGSTDIRVTYESLRISLEDAYKNAELSLEQAELAYDNAQKIRSATLIQLDASRKNTQIALDQARRDYAKLSISAPVDGTVTRVIASVWQSVNIGTPIIEFSGKQPQIVIDIDAWVARTLSVGEKVMVDSEGKTLTGVIVAVSSVSNANLLSTIRINVENAENAIGKSASITFRTVGSKDAALLLPIDAVRIISEWEWEVNLLVGTGTITTRSVKLWRVSETSIEILSEFAPDDLIITNNLTNYSPEKNILNIKK
jgi:multidrug resistance efflux pump